MRQLVLTALVAVLSVIAAQASHNSEGDWSRPVIDNLTHAPTFDEQHTLYARYNSFTHSWFDFNFTQGEKRLAVARVDRTKNVEGWEHIAIGSVNETDGWFTSGYAEGFITYDDIYSTYVDQVQEMYNNMQSNQAALSFVQQHRLFEKNHERKTAFGRQLHNQMRLIDGLAAGFAAAYDLHKPANMTKLDDFQMYCISFMEGLSNVLAKYPMNFRKRVPPALQPLQTNRLHCSAMMRLVGGDFFFSHDTWSSFNTMLRQLKSYDIGKSKVIMSGYAGSISSIDDFYMTSNHLAVTETTNGFFNESLYDEIVPKLVSEFNRVMIANFLAEDPAEWVSLFSHENSGTYNNQYMVAHMKVIRDALRGGGKTIPKGSFYVAEQIPGLIVARDQTDFVNTNGYWPSYNVPFYPEIYNRSGFNTHDTPEYWGLDNYHEYARARIFKRMHPLVKDPATMFYAMRFNNWREDHDSTIPWCHTNWTRNGVEDCHNNTQGASLAIASRYDLNPLNVPVPPGGKVGLPRAMFGAIDTKMTSATWMGEGEFKMVAVNGPTRVQNPVFDHDEWVAANPNNEDINMPWRGLANRFDFHPVLFTDSDSPTMAPPGLPGGNGDDDDHKKRDIAIGVGVTAGVCVVGIIGVLVWRQMGKSSSTYDESRALV